MTLLSSALPVSLHAMPVSSAPPLVLVSQTNPPIYNSDGTVRTDANGNPVTSPRLIDLEFANPLTKATETTRVRILLPANYPGGGARFPVLYLLHGAKLGLGLAQGEQYEWWTRWASDETLFDFTADKDVVVVMPEGGAVGFYSDWFNGGSFGSPMWETFHLAQLIPYIEANYKVRTDRGGRVIAGVSMGGFGTMSYAARQPDLFAGSYSFSGMLDNTLLGPVNAVPIELIGTEAIWGPFLTQEVRWRGHNPVDLAGNLAPLTLWFRTAAGVPHEVAGETPPPNDSENVLTYGMEALVAPLNDEFHIKLNSLQIAHEYWKEAVGGHSGYHFMESLLLAWPNIEADFRRTAQDPVVFNYRSIEPSIRIWGWNFTVTRDVVEFLYLSNVSKSGLTIRGSGQVNVQTAPVFKPNHYYTLIGTGSPGVAVSPNSVKADNEGRLKFEVRLGASHALQQYTPEQKAVETLDPFYWKEAVISIVP